MCSILDGSNGLFGSKFCSTTNHRTVWKRANGRPEKSGPRGGDHGGAKDQRTNQKSRFVTKTAFLQSSNAQTSFSRSREQIQPTQLNERLPLWIYPSISLSNVAESDTRNKILSILSFIDVLGTTGDGVKAEKEPEYMGGKIFLSAARHDHYHCSLFLS